MLTKSEPERAVDTAEERLLSGHYDELLSDFRSKMDHAIAVLREYQQLMQAGSAQLID